MEILIQKTEQGADVSEETFLTEEFSSPSKSSDVIKAPANIYEDDEEYRVELLMPGYTKDDFEIEISANGILNINTRVELEETGTEVVLRKEFSLPGYSRSFQVPDNSSSDEIVASYEGGVLIIILPKDDEIF